MFEHKIIRILNDPTKSSGWETVSSMMKLPIVQLKERLLRHDFTFEQLLMMVRVSQSPILLRDILNQLGLCEETKPHSSHSVSLRCH